MGTSIELCLGNVSLSYSKNHMGIDYGYFFTESDLTRRRFEPNDNQEASEETSELYEGDEAYVSTLSCVLPRLNLLGFTLDTARDEYLMLVADAEEYFQEADIGELENKRLTFEEFCNLACRYPLADLNDEYIDHDTPERDIISQGRFTADAEEINRIPYSDNEGNFWSEASFLADKLCILSAESMLQIFALNPKNADVEVTWEFGPIVDAGWVGRDLFQAGARQNQRILIATEGTSDANIIRRALSVFRPDVADFFHFVDVSERHPFWGTGNLVKFAEGLLRIDLLNQVLFVFDNDAEGIDAYLKLKKLALPINMRAMTLPDLEEFREFTTMGPEGINISDINGRAAAIECYLDLRLEQYPPAKVTWSNFKKDIKTWHGVLDFKESYSKHFYEHSDDDLRTGSYDSSKLEKLIDMLIHEAVLVKPVI